MRFGRFLGFTALGIVFVAASAQATGFSRGTADTDILFEPGNFNMRAGASFALPRQTFKTDVGGATTGGVVGTNYLDNYVIPSAAVKFAITENLSCAGTYTDAYGAASSFDAPGGFGPAGKLSESFTVAEFGATCAVFFDVGQGRLAVLGGAFVERFDYGLSALPPMLGGMPLDIDLSSNAYGWRAGLAYEVPDIALRAQLLYRSGTTHSAEGLANGALPAVASGELPQSVELKLQSGIAPGWLAFGSVKWTDWSVNERLEISIPVSPVGPITSANEYHWRDGWTVNAGVAHAFTESVSGLASVQWDRGVSTGYDLRSDRWRVVVGGSFRDTLGGELRLAGGVSHLRPVEITEGPEAGASVGSGWAGILSASYSVRW